MATTKRKTETGLYLGIDLDYSLEYVDDTYIGTFAQVKGYQFVIKINNAKQEKRLVRKTHDAEVTIV